MMEENGLPKGWVEVTLGEISNISTGFPFKSKKYSDSGELRVVRGENVSLKKLRWDNAKYWNHSTENLEQYLLDEDDIVIGMDGSRIGKNKSSIPSSELPLILAQRVARVKANKNTYQGFLKYCILNKMFERYIIKVQTGTSIPHISLSQIRDYDIIIPESLHEQQAIASILTTFDDKIELLQAQNETLETIAQTIFKEWFGKYQVGDELPEGWRVGKLGDVATHSKVSVRPFENPKVEYFHFSLPAYDDGLKPIVERGEMIKSNKYIVETNAFLVSKLNPFTPRIWTIFNSQDNFICSTEFQVVKPKSEKYFSLIHCLLNSDRFTNNVSSG